MTNVKIAVIGGGITGRLVQVQVPSATVYDWNPLKRDVRPLTRSYGANYLWRPLPGLDCKVFQVRTEIDGKVPDFNAVKAYKDKIGRSGDVEGWEQQFQHIQDGYDFLSFPEGRIEFDHRVVMIDRLKHTLTFAKQGQVTYDVLVSTIPLYTLLSMLDMDEPMGRLAFKPIYFRVTRRPPDAPYPSGVMYVNYLTDPTIGPYRFCDRNGERHYESIVPYEGLPTKRFSPGKIYPHAGVPDTLDVLEGFNIYTFGRFASWAPNELVHQTFDRITDWKEGMGL